MTSGDGTAEGRRVVTALFADIVGSTALAERLDPEDVYEIVGGAVTLMVGRVDALGGTVKDLAGDGMLALFGAPVAHEDDAVRAVLCGLRIVDAMADYAQDVAAEWGVTGFSVRVGIETGHAVTGLVGGGSRVEFGATGDAINTAARLQSHADPGTVLVGAATRRMTGARFWWGAGRSLQVKGKELPVEAASALGVTGGHGESYSAQAPTVGRDREIVAIARALDRLHAGRGGVVAVLGEAGVGKSRLVAETHRFAEERDLAWLRADAASYSGTTPFAHVRDLVLGWLGVPAEAAPAEVHTAVARRAAAVPAAADPLSVLLPMLTGAESGVDATEAESLQERLFHAVQHLIDLQAASRPTVVVLEDLHWSDPTSLALTERLALLAPTSRLLLVLTTRPEDAALAMLRRLEADDGPAFVRLALEPLTHQENRQLLHVLLDGAALPPALERRLLDTTEGNPFFVEEQVRALVATGALLAEGGALHWSAGADVAIAPTLERALVARMDRLPTEDRRTLLAAAVLGPQFDVPLLAGVIGHDPTAELESLRRNDMVAVDEATPTRAGRYRFHHALLQEAAYRSLLRRRRRALHARAAEALRALYAGREDDVAAALGRHLAESGDSATAVPYLLVAARRALTTYSNQEALQLVRAATEALGDTAAASSDEERDTTALELARIEGAACRSLARYDQGADAFRRALSLLPAEDVVTRARTRALLGEVLELQHEYEAALVELRAAADSLAGSLDDPDAFSAWLDAMLAQGNVFYWLADDDAYQAMLAAVEPEVERRATPQQRIGFFSHVRSSLLRHGRWAITPELLRLDRRLYEEEMRFGDDEQRAWAPFMHGFTLMWHRDVDAAEPMLRESLAGAERIGSALLRSRSLSYLMVTARFRGDVDGAAAMLADVRAAADDAALPEYAALASATAAWIAHRRHDPGTVRKEGERALDIWARLPNRYVMDWMAALPLLAEAVQRADVDDAVQFAAAVLDPRQQELPDDVTAPLRHGIDAAEVEGSDDAALQWFSAAVESAGTYALL